MRHDLQREMGVSWPERLVDQLGAGLAVIDEEGRYLYVNAAFTRLGVLPDGAGLERRVPAPRATTTWCCAR